MPGLTSIEEAAKNTDGSQTELRLLHESMGAGGGGQSFTSKCGQQSYCHVSNSQDIDIPIRAK